MSQTAHEDLERANNADSDQTWSTRNTPSQPPGGASSSGDSSGSFFSIYSKAAEEEDNKMVERWQKDADGILIFTGLFSAAVAALLAVTVQDLRPNSQDTSSFYLANIFQVLADPNVTRSSIPSPVAKPPRFTPPRYAVWVNSLWFLSLVMGLSCALLATSLHQWARRYLRMAQPARCSPEKRARMRAFSANGVEKMHVPWAVEGLPTLLHLSLFLFFGGLVIFLFNIDQEVFISVVWWIGLFSVVYGLITLLPIIRHDCPYNSPLSIPAWFLYAGIHYVTFRILAFTTSGGFGSFQTWERYKNLRDHYEGWMLGGVEKAAEETASERLWEIDVQILDWIISALGDDNSLKSFFEAIPGLFNSKLVKHLERDFPEELLRKFGDALDVFLGRTWSSNSINDSEKLRRLTISMNAMNMMPHSNVSLLIILRNILFKHWDEVPQTIEMGQTVARWCTSSDWSVAQYAQTIIARILARVRVRKDSWVALAARVFGLPERDLWDNIALGGDYVLLAILIRVTRQYLRSGRLFYLVLKGLSRPKTLPKLQHHFCTLWNEIVQEARNQGPNSTPIYILHAIHHLYIALHQGTSAAPTAFSASTDELEGILFEPWSYPLCDVASHGQDSVVHIPILDSHLLTPLGNSPDSLSPSPTDAGSTVPRQAMQTNIIAGLPAPSNPTTTSEIRETSLGTNTASLTNPAHSRPCPTGDVAAMTQTITSTVTLSRPPEGSEQQDIVAPCAEPNISHISSAASTPTPTPTLVPTSLPNTPSESYHASVASVSNSSYFALPPIGSSIPASRPTGSTTLPRLRPRGLVNLRNICFANAVLQLLANSPPFWNLFRELGDLKAQRGAGVPETGGGATPLVDATVRFLKEFVVEESPSTQQQSQPATGGTSRADEEKKDDEVVDSFEPTYMYDAMSEKRQLKPLLNGQQQDAEEFFRLYLDALDEELIVLLTSISEHKSTSVEERGVVSQSGQSEMGNRALTANLAESLITRIFGGEFRSTIRVPNHPDSVTIENWRSLHLDIQPDSVLTVQDALMRVSQSRSMQDGPSVSSDASQRMLIDSLPPVLTIHLKRFRYDAATGCVIKIGKPVQFSPELEIPFDVMVPTARQPAKPAHYTLCGVLYHYGESASGGHYSVDVLHPNGDGGGGEVWLRIDDEAVSVTRHKDVFGGQDSAAEQADERSAYMLFYCRTAPSGIR